MSISSDILFHFTGKAVLQKILLEGRLRGKYCEEQIVYADNSHESRLVIPMISLCDVPLENYVNSQGEKYGYYAIGLKKKWGFDNGLNPVLYIDKHSSLNKMMGLIDPEIGNFSENIYASSLSIKEKLLNLETSAKELDFSNLEVAKPLANKIKEETLRSLDEANSAKRQLLIPKFFIQLLEFMKFYEGDLERNESITPNYRYYDEMEWRYVPNRNNLTPYIGIKELNKFEEYKKSPIDERLLFELQFTYEDIEQIVVEKHSEVDEFKSFLQELGNSSFSSDKREELCLKIISVDTFKKT